MDVGALPVFRGVKCCCRVEKAGRDCFLASSLAYSTGFDEDVEGGRPTVRAMDDSPDAVRSPASGFDLTLVDRVAAPARLEALGSLGAASVGVLLEIFEALGGISNDLGLPVCGFVSADAVRLLETELVD